MIRPEKKKNTDLNFSHHWYKPTVNTAISCGNNANELFPAINATITSGTAGRCCRPTLTDYLQLKDEKTVHIQFLIHILTNIYSNNTYNIWF